MSRYCILEMNEFLQMLFRDIKMNNYWSLYPVKILAEFEEVSLILL
jgi:hypothetical protein